jgi:hypothetical protein
LSRTGRQYPLIVNLTTVAVYSFEEESEVMDPYLKDHLAHFGLDLSRMQCNTYPYELNEQLRAEMTDESVRLHVRFLPKVCVT